MDPISQIQVNKREEKWKKISRKSSTSNEDK